MKPRFRLQDGNHMGRNLIIGDIHSRYEKLTAVLEKASYDPDSDILYWLKGSDAKGYQKRLNDTLRWAMTHDCPL